MSLSEKQSWNIPWIYQENAECRINNKHFKHLNAGIYERFRIVEKEI